MEARGRLLLSRERCRELGELITTYFLCAYRFFIWHFSAHLLLNTSSSHISNSYLTHINSHLQLVLGKPRASWLEWHLVGDDLGGRRGSRGRYGLVGLNGTGQ